MALYGTMRLPHEWKIQNTNHRHSNQISVVGKGQVHFVSINLSSHGLRHDSWSLHLLSSRHSPISPISGRCKVFFCRSVLVPSAGNEFPLLKSAAIVLVRCKSYIAGRPLVHKLIPAVGIIAFAAWGLVPLVRLGRVVLFNRTDNSWKKSSSHHVTTSYIQPILFWTGALFICRALEPLVLPTEASQAVKQRLLNFLRSLSTVLAFAHCLSSLIQQVQKYFMETNDSSDARNMGFGFVGKAVYTAVWVAAVSLFMELLGFSTQKWVTAGGLGTVLLTLAGREIFTNFLSSVMIQATRPFIVNEWIQTKIEGYEVSGTVEHVGWWSPTIIRGDDREAIHIPNHKFTVNIVRNLSQKTHWRVKTHLAISHLDVSKINNIVADMRKVLAKNSQVEQQRLHRRVFLDNVNPENQALMIMVSCFVKTSHFEEYLCVKEAILLDLLRVISHHRARLATPIRTVRKVYGETDLDNVPFADSPFSRSRALNRSYLLIEPSYKINDDKSKASTRSVHINEDTLGVQAEATSTSDPKTSDQVKALTLTSNPITNSTRPTPPSDSESQNLASDGSSSKLESTGYDGKKKVGVDRKDKSPLGETSEKLQATSSESGNGKRESSSTTLQSKQDDEKPHASPSTATPPLEDNIVLGVALEGSKRTLPIEEETSPAPTESKEMAAGQKGDLLPVGKDAKDVQKPPISGSKSSD